ncbi:hypothetical protein HOLleu_02073 [Holothuria leucospilota]|uniref:Uncharacterized protein n=1 Tax=Holothuria leucospilota TaxID=206669 RepID=A0A9Q1CRN9_HOLLE|nr:hypothetical protein HOLleu_02073 [Holothuria leucospilota]
MDACLSKPKRPRFCPSIPKRRCYHVTLINSLLIGTVTLLLESRPNHRLKSVVTRQQH